MMFNSVFQQQFINTALQSMGIREKTGNFEREMDNMIDNGGIITND